MWTEDRKRLFAAVEEETLTSASTISSSGQPHRQVVITAATVVPAPQDLPVPQPQVTAANTKFSIIKPVGKSPLADQSNNDDSGPLEHFP
jgi:hypothetical protein